MDETEQIHGCRRRPARRRSSCGLTVVSVPPRRSSCSLAVDPVEEDTWGSMAAEAGRGLAPAAAVRARLSLASTAKSGAEGQRREGRTGGRQQRGRAATTAARVGSRGEKNENEAVRL